MGKEPTLEEWGRLYQAAMAIKELAPWEWMDETDIFGLENSETGELGFVSVMGALGEHLAVALYYGSEGLYGFQQVCATGDYGAPEDILDVRQVQASFEDRELVEKADRQVIKSLGLHFRGPKAWPIFRSYEPGYLPWQLAAEEVRFLTLALEQLLEVAPRFIEDPLLLDTGDNEDTYLIRTPKGQGEALVWEDERRQVPPPDPVEMVLRVDPEVLERVRSLPQSDEVLEVDCTVAYTPIGERNERPYLPHLLLMVDSDTGMVLGLELLVPDPDINSMWAELPQVLLSHLDRQGLRPRQINVRSPKVRSLIAPVLRDVGVRVQRVLVLDAAEEARESLKETLMGRGAAQEPPDQPS